MRIINECYDRTGAFTLIKNGVIIANGLKMSNITKEMIEKCYVDMDDIVVFNLPRIKDRSHICGSDYDAFIVDFNDQVEHDDLLYAVLQAYKKHLGILDALCIHFPFFINQCK